MIAAYHGGVTQAVLEVNAYLRNPTSGLKGSGFQVYVDLLGAPNQIQTRSYKNNYYVVVTPSPEPQIDQVRHAYLHFLLDPLSLRYFEQWGRDKALADFAQSAPALDDAYKNDFMLLATECVIKAVESRLARGGKKQELVSQALGQGFVITPALADGLAVYEKQPESLRNYFPDLLGLIDLDHEDRRLQKVEFAKEATVHKAKSAPPPPAPVLSASAKSLAEAEEMYTGRNLIVARAGYEKVLQLPAENPVHARAHDGLARIAALDDDPELAEKLFQKTLEMSPDDETKSWAHLYLGRLSDAAGEREQAEKHYHAALAVHGVPEQVKVAAERTRAAVSTVNGAWRSRGVQNSKPGKFKTRIQTLGAMMKRALRNIAALTWAAFRYRLFAAVGAAEAQIGKREGQAILAVQVAKTPDERIPGHRKRADKLRRHGIQNPPARKMAVHIRTAEERLRSDWCSMPTGCSRPIPRTPLRW